MSGQSAIEWTDRVWNPVVGCTKVSQGCKHCYAKTLHDKRHAAYLAGKLRNFPQYAQPFETVQLMPGRLRDPLGWRKPQRIFVNSVSDLFHEDIPDAFIDRVFAVMALCDGTRSSGRRHEFQILTKRPARMLAYMSDPETPFRVASEVCMNVMGFRPTKGSFDWHAEKTWPLPNVWLGVSVEHQAAADERIPLLLKTPAAVRFLSCEPLLDRLDLAPYLPVATIGGVEMEAWPNWVIVGGESGKGARPFDTRWAHTLVEQCRAAGVAVFVKQLGALPVDTDCGDGVYLPEHERTHRAAKAFGFDHTGGLPNILLLKDSHGGDSSEWPEDLRVREFPAAREAANV